MILFFYVLLDNKLIDDNMVCILVFVKTRYIFFKYRMSVDESNLSIVVPFVIFSRSEFDHVKDNCHK